MNSFEVSEKLGATDAVECVQVLVHALLPKQARSVITVTDTALGLQNTLHARFSALGLAHGDTVEVLPSSEHGLQSLRIGVYRPRGNLGMVPHMLAGEKRFPTLDIAHHTDYTVGLDNPARATSWQFTQPETIHGGLQLIQCLSPDVHVVHTGESGTLYCIKARDGYIEAVKPLLYLERNGTPLDSNLAGPPRPWAIWRQYLSDRSRA